MRVTIPMLVVLVLAAPAALAGGDSFSSGPDEEGYGPGAQAAAPPSLYDRIYARYAHLGRNVREEFRDGPCRIKRHWERDGDFEEHIECRGPRR